ncbi:putative B-cell receptor-associated protein 29/31 [Tanacetum coccineum]
MRKATILTIAGTMSVILFSNWVSIVKIQNKGAKIGTMTPMDQVLWRTHLLEASLMELEFRMHPDAIASLRHSVMLTSDAIETLALLAIVQLVYFDLAGFSLYLGFLIDRMHHHLHKLINLRKNGGSSKKVVENLEAEKLQLKEKEDKANEEVKRLQKEISTLSESLKKLKFESKEKDKKIETAEAHVASLQKQSADLLLEYDRLLEDNQNLQAQTKNRHF